LEQAIEVVSAANFDVLFYWEVGSDITNYFLPFFRAAPIQCTGWGVPVTSGIPQMDYFLSSKLVEPPEADRHYSEQLIQARTLLTWQERVRIPDHPKSRESFGFSRSRNLYVCVQQTRKIHPDFDPMLAGILRNDPRATVVIVEDSRKQTAHRLRERFSRTLADVIERVVFLPQLSVLDYLALLNEADVLLDTPHFGGGITTYDGLSLNKPIVTLPSGFRRGRFATACYLMMGVLDCVSESADDYVATAVELAANRDWRAHVESRIQETSSVLFENNQAVREFERILLRLIAAARRSPIQDRTIGAA
jgi:predicted O-linked N-acetylglucosamine transferase (SPINDLY family)